MEIWIPITQFVRDLPEKLKAEVIASLQANACAEAPENKDQDKEE